MDKNAIKKFAVWARTELIARVSLKCVEYGITEDNIEDANADSVGGKVLTADEKKQRQALIAEINDKGYKQVMEEVAYTWFNRFSALRFMEVNGYLPSHVRVFTDEENNFKPQIITEAIHLDLDGLDMEKVYELKDAEKTEELYKYLLIVQCNALNKILPGMFQRLSDYTELLLPDNLLREGSVIQQMIELIPEDDWKDAVQIIGWLYQFYNIEPKAKVFSKEGRLSKVEIPAATQLFTPDWIVRYLVENSLGRSWFNLTHNTEVKSTWKYYMQEAEQEENIKSCLESIWNNQQLDIQKLRCIDPCMGSGHILTYMFDVLVQIYISDGYSIREAVESIVTNNLWGLDVDERAAQLAYFSIMMKARQYDRRFFARNIQPNVFEIRESNGLDKACIDYFVNDDSSLKKALSSLLNDLHDAKEYGSILNVQSVDFSALYDRFDAIQSEISLYTLPTLSELLPLVKVAEVMTQKYDVVVTNPPYLNQDNMPPKLLDYVLTHYEMVKYDLYAVFMLKCKAMLMPNGIMAMITMHNFMYAKGFARLREHISNWRWINMIHLGPRAFSEISGEVVQTCAFCIGNEPFCTNMQVCNLVEIKNSDEKETAFLSGEYSNNVLNFNDVPCMPGGAFGYGLGDKILGLYKENSILEKFVTSKAGVVTGKDDYFIRHWSEIRYDEITFMPDRGQIYKYTLFSKGGTFDRWYGNDQYVIKLKDLWDDRKTNKSVRRGDRDYYFRRGIGWSQMGGGVDKSYSEIRDCVCKNSTPMIYLNDARLFEYVLGYLNSGLVSSILKALNPTLSMFISDIFSLPFIVDEARINDVKKLVNRAMDISRGEYVEKEEHWQFIGVPYCHKGSFAAQISNYQKCRQENCQELYNILDNLNLIFSEIMGFGRREKMTFSDCCYTPLEDVKRFISYAVGCMFGRYSLDVSGIAFAGGKWDTLKYVSFPVDRDGIIPICDDEYFKDDIVGLFVEFVKTVYGADTLDENLKFIADALGGKGQPKDVIRNYFLSDFYSDHCKIYQKRPIYWLFDSGKKNGFKALIYMHRYQPDTIARIRTDYVHEQQARYRTAIADLEQRIANASTGERVKLNRKLTTLQAQDNEIRTYEEKIHHLADQMIPIDLDDGVKKNYAIFQDVLAKIK
ncbi:BREX-1 system adenine-specific DNA-methyltransferase PglX [Clostridiaceae bacterium Marseille-Q4143]|nr:BREX-1 system adenine-specific DNA-methyltransferase PglX [Clostridiaceae bacterium Marseille-Q4143]